MEGASIMLRRMAGLGITPNMVSYFGLACSLVTASCFALGAADTLPWETGDSPSHTSWWPLVGAVLYGFSAIADVVDGHLARSHNLATKFGAVLDSTLDRFGEMAVFIGCAVHFAARGNVTYVLIACIAMTASTQISYVKARAENMTTGLGVGFWQRAERMVALIIAGLSGRIPSALCIMALFPMFTVLRRVVLAQRLLGETRESRLEAMFDRVLPWRQPRFAGAYLALCAGIAMAIVVLPWLHPFFYGVMDPLKAVLRLA
jgi:CDP-diacylglycerol--glycerol-3-phosphate 3-phosphatidyltransferase